MPTPAINRSEIADGSLTRDYYVNGILQSHNVYYREAGFNTEFRPASVSSGIRPDRTRAPRGWHHSGSRWANALGVSSTSLPGSVRYVNTGRLSNKPLATGNLIPTVTSANALRDAARIQALKQVTQRVAEFGEALSQVKSTSKMVAGFAKGFALGLDDLMQRHPKMGRFTQWRSLPDKYLEYCYGWAPLADDIANGLDLLLDYRNRGMEMSFRLRAKKSSDSRGNLGEYQGDRNGFYRWMLQYREKSHAYVSYYFRIPPWWFDQLPIIAPFSTLYAMMPYSFVLDWISPFGDWLGAFESAQLSPLFKEGSETRIVRRTYTSRTVPVSGTTTFEALTPPRGSGYAMIREALTSLPTVLMTPPGFRDDLSLTQVAQGMALLTQVFKRWS